MRSMLAHKMKKLKDFLVRRINLFELDIAYLIKHFIRQLVDVKLDFIFLHTLR